VSTILCVDDQVSGLEIRKLLLESRGYYVITAATVAETLTALRREPVDLLILDYRLAETTGDVLAQEVKREWPDVPIMLLSGYPAVPESARAAVDAFVVKGESAAGFLDKVASLLDSHSTSQSASPLEVTRAASRSLIRESREIRAERAAKLDFSRKLVAKSRELRKETERVREQWRKRDKSA
jgi:DNA-binding NtrC family response regulator